MVKNLTQTECLAYNKTIMQNQNRKFWKYDHSKKPNIT